jgi:hypothetical protein
MRLHSPAAYKPSYKVRDSQSYNMYSPAESCWIRMHIPVVYKPSYKARNSQSYNTYSPAQSCWMRLQSRGVQAK